MKPIQISNNYDNVYEREYMLNRGKAYFNESDWKKMYKQGDADLYLTIMRDSEKLPTLNHMLERNSEYRDYSTDERVQFLLNELYGDRDTIKDYTKNVFNPDKNAYEEVKVQMSEYDYNKDYFRDLNESYKAARLKSEELDRKNSLSTAEKVFGTIGAVGGELALGAMNMLDDTLSLFGAIGNGLSSAASGGNFDSAFREVFDNDYVSMFKNAGWTDAIIDWERKYTDMRDIDGNYTNLGKYLGGVSYSLGLALPTMALNLAGGGIAKVASSSSANIASVARTIGSGASKAATLLYYTGMASSNMDEAFYALDEVSVPTWQIILNSTMKSAAEYGVNKIMTKAFGSTAIDKIMFGYGQSSFKKISAKSAFARIGKDALKEACEEALQEMSGGLVDSFFEVYNNNFGKIKNLSLQTLFDSFILGGLSSIGGSIASVAFTKKVDTHNVSKIKEVKHGKHKGEEKLKTKKLGKFASWAYKINLDEMMSKYSSIIYDETMTNDERLEAAGQMYSLYRTLTSIYNEIGEERFNTAKELLQKISDDAGYANTVAMATNMVIDYNVLKGENQELSYNSLKYGKVIVEADVDEDALTDQETQEKLTQLLEDADRNDLSDDYVVDSANDIVDKGEKSKRRRKRVAPQDGVSKELKDFDGFTICITEKGSRVVQTGDIIYVPRNLFENGGMSAALKSNAEVLIVNAFANNIGIKPEMQLILKAYRIVSNNPGAAMVDAATNMLFNDSFYNILLRSEHKLILNLINQLDNVIKSASIKGKSLKKKEFLQVYNSIKKRMRKAIMAVAIENANFYVDDLTCLTKEDKVAIHQARWKQEKIQKLKTRPLTKAESSAVINSFRPFNLSLMDDDFVADESYNRDSSYFDRTIVKIDKMLRSNNYNERIDALYTLMYFRMFNRSTADASFEYNTYLNYLHSNFEYSVTPSSREYQYIMTSISNALHEKYGIDRLYNRDVDDVMQLILSDGNIRDRFLSDYKKMGYNDSKSDNLITFTNEEGSLDMVGMNKSYFISFLQDFAYSTTNGRYTMEVMYDDKMDNGYFALCRVIAISDEDAKIELPKSPKLGKIYTFSDFVSDYTSLEVPSYLANVKVIFSEDLGENIWGQYDSLQDTIYLSTDILTRAGGYNAKKTLFHELTHAVQHKMGLATGNSVENAKTFDSKLFAKNCKKNYPLFYKTCLSMYEGDAKLFEQFVSEIVYQLTEGEIRAELLSYGENEQLFNVPGLKFSTAEPIYVTQDSTVIGRTQSDEYDTVPAGQLYDMKVSFANYPDEVIDRTSDAQSISHLALPEKQDVVISRHFTGKNDKGKKYKVTIDYAIRHPETLNKSIRKDILEEYKSKHSNDDNFDKLSESDIEEAAFDIDNVSEYVRNYISQNAAEYELVKINGEYKFVSINSDERVKFVSSHRFRRSDAIRDIYRSGKLSEPLTDESSNLRTRKFLKNPTSMRASITTIDEVFSNPKKFLKQEILDDIVRYIAKRDFGENADISQYSSDYIENCYSKDNLYDYFKNKLAENGDGVSIGIVDGKVKYVKYMYMDKLLTKEASEQFKDKKSHMYINDDTSIRKFIDPRYLIGRLAEIKIKLTDTDSYYNIYENVIYLNNAIKSKNDRLYQLIHEFQHAIQFEYSMNSGLNFNFKVSSDMIADVLEHSPQMVRYNHRPNGKMSASAMRNSVKNFIYYTTGEAEAYQDTDYMNFYPTVVSFAGSSQIVTMPWGTQYNLNTGAVIKPGQVVKTTYRGAKGVMSYKNDSKKRTRKVSNKDAKGTNLEFFIKKNKPIQMHVDLQDFILHADLEKLPKELSEKISGSEKGTLTHWDVVAYARTHELDDYTFKLYKKYIVKNKFIKSQEQLSKYALYLPQAYAIYNTLKGDEKYSKLVDSEDAVKVSPERLEAIEKVILKTPALKKRYLYWLESYNYGYGYKPGSANNKLLDIDTNEKMYSIFKDFDGKLYNLAKIAQSLRFISSLGWQYSSKRNVSTSETVGDTDTELEEMLEDPSAERAMDDIIDDTEDESDAIRIIIEDKIIPLYEEAISKMHPDWSRDKVESKLDSIATKLYEYDNLVTVALAYKSAYERYGSYMSDEAMDNYLNPNYDDVANKGFVRTRTRASVKNNCSRIAGRISAWMSSTQFKKNYDVFKPYFNEDGTFKKELIVEKPMEELMQLEKELKVLLKNVTEGAYLTKRSKDYLSTAKKQNESLRRRLLKAQTTIQELKKENEVLKSTEVVYDNIIFKVKSTRAMPEPLKRMIETKFTMTQKTKSHGKFLDDHKHVRINAKEFLDANAEVLVDLTINDVRDILDFYSGVVFDNDSVIDSTALRQFKAVRMLILTYLSEQAEKGLTSFTMDNDDKVILNNLLTSIKGDAGMELSVYQAAIRELNPAKVLVNSFAKVNGIEFTEDEVQDIVDSMQAYADGGDISHMQDAYNSLYKKTTQKYKANSMGKVNLFFDRLWKLQRAFMLSGPGTWIRNIVSNKLVYHGNNLSDRIGNFVLKTFGKDKHVDGQLRIYKTQPSAQAKAFVKHHVEDTNLLDMLVDGITKYDTDTLAKHKLNTSMTELLVRSVVSKVFADNTFTSRKLQKVSEFIFERMSDKKYIYRQTLKYYEAALTETAAIDTDFRMNEKALQLLVECYETAAFEYMHKRNMFDALEDKIRGKGGATAMFVYKQILPFASASWNWFCEGLKYSPVGLVKSIIQFAKLENTIEGVEQRRMRGDDIAPTRFTEYLLKRDIGKGTLGTVGTIIGLLLGGFGLAEVDEYDGKAVIKIPHTDITVDISKLFGTQGILLGLAFMTPKDAVDDDASYEQKLKAHIKNVTVTMNTIFSTLVNDSIFSDLYNTFRFNDTVGEWVAYQPVKSLSMFIPNAIKMLSRLTYNHKVDYGSDFFKSQINRLAVQALPFYAYSLPIRVDPYTGKAQTKYRVPFINEFFNSLSPIKVGDMYVSDAEKVAIAVGSRHRALTGRYKDIGQLDDRDVVVLNEYYGTMNNKVITSFINNEFKMEISDGNKKKSIYYKDMDNEQIRHCIDSIMNKNASYAKIYVWTVNGGKYYASDKMYAELTKLGITKNIYKSSSKHKGFSK